MRHLVDGELSPEVGLRPEVLHVFLDDSLHPQLFQAVGDIIERILIWKNCQSLEGWGGERGKEGAEAELGVSGVTVGSESQASDE